MRRFALIAAVAALSLFANAASAANVLVITEFSQIGVPANGGQAQVAELPSSGDQTQTTADFTSSPQTSSAVKSQTTLVRLHCAADNTSNCAVNWGTNPSNASSSDMPIGIGKEEYFSIPQAFVGAGIKFSVTTTTH